jgi:hypothetical protein
MEKHSLHCSTRQPCSDSAEHPTASEQTKREQEELHADLSGLGSQGHSHPNLTAPLFDRVAQYPKAADCNQQ